MSVILIFALQITECEPEVTLSGTTSYIIGVICRTRRRCPATSSAGSCPRVPNKIHLARQHAIL